MINGEHISDVTAKAVVTAISLSASLPLGVWTMIDR